MGRGFLKIIAIFFCVVFCTYCSKKEIDIQLNVITGDATDITSTSAKIYGSFSANNVDVGSVAAAFFVYSDATSGWDDFVFYEADCSDGNMFYVVLENLQPDTEYHYSALCSVGMHSATGEDKSFTTKGVPAEVLTQEAENVQLFSASLRGRIELDNLDNYPVETWFLMSRTSNTLETLLLENNRLSAVREGNTINCSAEKLWLNTTYYYIACAKISNTTFYGDVKSFKTASREVPSGAVELGLSVMWAAYNIGASSPEDYGDYYAWGETKTKSYYSDSTYKWGDWTKKGLTRYNFIPSYGRVDNWMKLVNADDAAYSNWGNGWRMPTVEEMQELVDNCTCTWTELNGIRGTSFISNYNGNSIFLPAGGYKQDANLNVDGLDGHYWTVNLGTTWSFAASCLSISNDRTKVELGSRAFGYSII